MMRTYVRTNARVTAVVGFPEPPPQRRFFSYSNAISRFSGKLGKARGAFPVYLHTPLGYSLFLPSAALYSLCCHPQLCLLCSGGGAVSTVHNSRGLLRQWLPA